MEAYEYLYIRPGEGEDSYSNWWLNCVPKKMRAKVRKYYIWKAAPVRREEVEEIGAAGLQLTLPFSERDLRTYNIEEVHDFLAGIIERESVQNIVVDPALRKYMGSIEHMEGNSLSRLFLNEMMEDARRRHRISKKELALIVLDDSIAGEIQELMKERREELNYLTIMTEQPEVYERFCDQLFEETGLLVQVLRPEEVQAMSAGLHGNMVLDFRRERDKLYRLFPQSAVVLELSGNQKKVRDLIVKRKDLHVYNRAEVFHGNKKLNPGIMEIRFSDRAEVLNYERNICVNCCLTLD